MACCLAARGSPPSDIARAVDFIYRGGIVNRLPLRRIGEIVEASPFARKEIGYTRDTLRRAPPEIRGGSPKWATRGRGSRSARRSCSA